jgi:hypothetical protein
VVGWSIVVCACSKLLKTAHAHITKNARHQRIKTNHAVLSYKLLARESTVMYKNNLEKKGRRNHHGKRVYRTSMQAK